MRLDPQQKEYLLILISEELQFSKINEKAGEFNPPFNLSRQSVNYYRSTRGAQIKVLKGERENKSLQEGLSRKIHRVNELKKLAAGLSKDIFEKELLWISQEKTVAKESFKYQEFNKPLVDSFLKVLDDLAKEVGHRASHNIEKTIDLDKLSLDQLERLAAGEDLLTVLVG